MGIILKLMASPALRAIVAQLLSWLLSECAGFVARYLSRASEIVKEAATLTEEDGTATPGTEKFRYAGDKLKAELLAEGKEVPQHFVDSAIQAAVGAVKAQEAKK